MTDQSDQSDEDVMWPIGCIKPGTCERKGECSYQPCPHESKDITSEIRRAASALAKPVITEDDGTREPVPEGWQPSTFNQSKPDLPDGDGLRTPAELELLAFNAIHVEAEKHWLAYLGADRHTAVVPPKDRLEYWIAAVAIAVTRKSPTRDGAEGAGLNRYHCKFCGDFTNTADTPPHCPDCGRLAQPAAPPKPAPDAVRLCDCERPEGDGVRLVSNSCPIHNDDPDLPPDDADREPAPNVLREALRATQETVNYFDFYEFKDDHNIFSDYTEGKITRLRLGHLRALTNALAAPVPSPDGKCPDCGKSLHDDDEPHQLDCENRPSPAVADAFETLIDQIAKIRDEYKDSRRNHLDQMELLVAQGDAKETSYRSTEAERDGAALHAVNRVLKILETIGYASPTVRGDREIPPVKRIECVKMVDCLEVEAEPLWRLEIGGICADFETETGANNFRNAILSLPVQPATRPDSAPEKRDTEPKIG